MSRILAILAHQQVCGCSCRSPSPRRNPIQPGKRPLQDSNARLVYPVHCEPFSACIGAKRKPAAPKTVRHAPKPESPGTRRAVLCGGFHALLKNESRRCWKSIRASSVLFKRAAPQL
jgi:hypothetical protein